MIKIKEFTFNPIQVNCYVLYNEENKCVIVDPSCYFENEYKLLEQFIEDNNLIPVELIATHFHFDHLMGVSKISKKYNIKLSGHENYTLLFDKFNIKEQIQYFDFDMEIPNPPSKLLKEGDIVNIGSDMLEVIHVPGHSPCSIALYCKMQNMLFSGDILFDGSIGRTDFYCGDYNLLITGIKEKLLVLPENTMVYPGHGATTTIGTEIRNNPFL